MIRPCSKRCERRRGGCDSTKALVATSRTQGDRPGDFSFTVDGELVYLGLVCYRSRKDPDFDECGCGRSFAGVNSHKATTTAVVVDVDLSRDQLVDSIAAGMMAAGWDPMSMMSATMPTRSLLSPPGIPVGTVVTRRLDVIRPAVDV